MSSVRLRRRSVSLALFAALLAALVAGPLAGCDDDEPAAVAPCAPPEVESLRWKRSDALFGDLSAALALDARDCRELGVPCDRLHRVALGGNDPFESTIYRPQPEPLVVTPLVAERVVMAACARRVALDGAAESAARVVFTALDFAADRAAPDAARDTTGALYRRLLGREAAADELDVVAELAADDVDPATFATLACFAVGTSTEFLFF